MLVRFAGIELGHIGSPGDVAIENFDAAHPAIRSSDTDQEDRDGVMPGRDFFGVRTLGFDVVTNRRTMVEARQTAAKLLAAWRDRSTRMASGVLVPLDFRAVDDPQWRRVYGRPRRADDPGFGVLMAQGAARMSLQFDVMEPRVFSGGASGLHEVTLRQAETVVSGGWTWPRDPGWPVEGEAVEGAREGALTVGGTEPTPVAVTFHGPGNRFELTGSRGWRVALKPGVELASDESITIDPLARRVVDNWGNPRFGALATPLFSVELDPGFENIFFSAVDQTLSARAVVQWRDAFSSLA